MDTGRPRRRSTLREVAARAGVSAATASKVLHDHPDVGAATKRRVLQAMRDLDYTAIGRPVPPRTMSIVAGFDSFETVYASEILTGLIDRATTLGVRVIADLPPTAARTQDPDDWMLRHAAAGVRGAVLVTVPITEPLVTAARRHDIELITIDPKTEVNPSVTTIGATNWAGSASATTHLLELGHTRIAFAGLDLNTDYSAERFAGYRSALERAGLTARPEYVGYGETEFEHGQMIGARFAALSTPPTAVVAVNDGVALGVIEGARRQGLLCPESLSVVGFDDIQPARWSTPLLTTVRQPLKEMGSLAVTTLLDQIAGKPPASPHLHLATTLIVRGSSRPA